MCGIAGVFGSGGSTTVRLMSESIRHRGPDDEGILRLVSPQGFEIGGLGHRRLAILDLTAAGHQPMTTPDGRFAIVFNGEIYNFNALRNDLLREGTRFRSHSDTEVLLHGVARHGLPFLSRVRGMFAFVFWDADKSTALLVRDQFGIKPLYVAQRGNRVLCASELRGMLASDAIPATPSTAGVSSYLEWGSVAEPDTIIAGVYALPAGYAQRVTIDRHGQATLNPPERFASELLNDPREVVRDAETAARLVRAALRGSVERHLVSDVPVAVFLSGGIDSSTVVALATEVMSARPETFCVIFAEEAFSEAEAARTVAKLFATRHHEIPLSGEQLRAWLPAAFRAMDQPSMDGLNTYAVSRAVREAGLKVVLSGLGGDEFFAGYPSFRRAHALTPLWRVPAWMRRSAAAAIGANGSPRAEKASAMLSGGSPAASAYRASRTLFGPTHRCALVGRLPWSDLPPPPRPMSRLQQVTWYEVNGYMRNTLLRDSDVFSMAQGLELRVPFVDVDVASATASVADAIKLRRGASKPLLLDAMGDMLPKVVWDRPKRGFVLPFEPWMRGPLRNQIAATLRSDALDRVSVDRAAAWRIWESFLSGRGGVSWSRPWALYTLSTWAANRLA